MAFILLLTAPLLLFCIYFAASSVRSYRRLRHFKGPRLAAWTDLWHVKLATSGKAHILFGDLVDQYGEYTVIPGCHN